MGLALLVVASVPSAGAEPSDAVVYLDQAEHIARWDVPSGRYPPGLPTLLAAGSRLGFDAWQTMKIIAMVLVVLIVLAAWRVAGSTAGAVAGALCCGSPWLIASSRYVMADPLAALLAVAGLIAVLARRPAWAAVAAAAGVMTRLLSIVGVAAVAAVGRRWIVVAAAGALVMFAAFQWVASGSPFSTGYEDGAAEWSPRYVVDRSRIGDGTWIVEGSVAKAITPDTPQRDLPNLLAYPYAIFGYVFLPPMVAAVGFMALWRRRSTPAARYVSCWMVGSLAVVLPYFFQSPRFLAPAMALLMVYTAAGMSDLITEVTRVGPPKVATSGGSGRAKPR